MGTEKRTVSLDLNRNFIPKEGESGGRSFSFGECLDDDDEYSYTIATEKGVFSSVLLRILG